MKFGWRETWDGVERESGSRTMLGNERLHIGTQQAESRCQTAMRGYLSVIRSGIDMVAV